VFARGRIDVAEASFAPWFEVARLSSDVYGQTETGPVFRISTGPPEHRVRGGLQATIALRERVSLRVEGFAEHVGTAGFIPGATDFNAGLLATLLWLGPGPSLR
jgi:hypothetical protein